LVGRFLADPEISAALTEVAPDGPARVEALIRGRSSSPLQGLVSGSLDLDKIEYLKRDARFCGVPYGEVDVDRLLYALVVIEDPATGRLEAGVREKGVAALESLLFAKYQMFRNVYWHHAVRAATVMYKRIVVDALAGRLLAPEELVGQTDESLLFLLESRSREGPVGVDAGMAARVGRWVAGLRARRLPKRVAEVVAADLDGEGVGEWMAVDSSLKREVEDRLAREWGVEPGGVFLDYPAKPLMFGLDLLVLRGERDVLRLGPGGQAGLIGLPRIADELYRTARVFRLFVLGGTRGVDPAALMGLATLSEPALRRRLEDPAPLL
jgi:hypothetical protein